MKKICILITVLLLSMFALTGCGAKDYCYRCEEESSELYYTYGKDGLLCPSCAKDYWKPFDYKDYKAKVFKCDNCNKGTYELYRGGYDDTMVCLDCALELLDQGFLNNIYQINLNDHPELFD